MNLIQFREVRHLGVKERWPSETNDAWTLRVGSPETLRPGMVNIIVGPNGSGKTTILEIIHAFSNPSLFKTLIRESQPAVTSFCIALSWLGGCVSVSHHRRDEGEFLDFIVQPSKSSFSLNLMHLSDEEIQRVSNFIRENIPFRSNYVRFSEEKQLLVSLDKTREHLGFFSKALQNIERGSHMSATGIEVMKGTGCESLMILFDTDPWMFSRLEPESLPMGWRRLVALMEAISNQKDEEILLIEEPDTHLHPRLQRELVYYILNHYKEKSRQIFLTTHSPTLLNASINRGFSMGGLVQTFRVSQGISWASDSISDVMVDLGARPADVFLANGIIWVEGPSDRIYILRWISDRCISLNKNPPVEGIDFVILIYGGKSGKHHSITRNDGIKIVHANPNYFIIGDSDNGSALAWNNLLSEALNLTDPENKCWLLEVRTIESFCFSKNADQTVSQKVKYASSRSIHSDWEDTVNEGIDRLLNAIHSWST